MKHSFLKKVYGITVLLCLSQFSFSDGMLTVRTTPEGIEVWLNDKYIGDSPVTDKKLKAGKYSLKLVDPVQHTSTLEEVFIQENETTTIDKTIKVRFGTLRVNSDPQGAEVLILSQLGKTPLSNEFMNPGKYRLEIRHPGARYHSVYEDIVIPRGEAVSLEKTITQDKLLNKKAMLRLGFGAGAIASYFWAIMENGNAKKNNAFLKDQQKITSPRNLALEDEYASAADGSNIKMILGAIAGTTCVLAFEFISFF